MKFSIVVINHNYGRYLAQAIETALAQPVSDLEVVVVDDGSSDDSRKIIESFGARIVAVYQTQGGHVCAVNAGYAACAGEGIVFLDADDFLYPNVLKAAEALFEPGCAKIQFRLDTVDEAGRDQAAPFPYFPEDLSPQEILRQSLEFGVYPWTVSSGNVFFRSFMEQVMPIDVNRIYRSPDGYLNKMAPLYGKVKTSRDVVGAYRVHGSNTWASAGQSLRSYPANRWVAFDRVLCDTFNARASALGYTPRSYDNLISLQRIEHRLMGLRADPEAYPIPGDTKRSLFMLGLRTARLAPNVSATGRAFWTIWLAALAFAPFWVIDTLHKNTRSQGERPALARLLVKFARGPATLRRSASARSNH